MDINDWRTQLQPYTRERIINKITDKLKEHLPFFSPEEILEKLSKWCEEKIYNEATSQLDYLRKLSLEILTMEIKPQNTMPNQRKPLRRLSAPPLHAVDWRTELQRDSRLLIVNIMIITLKKHQKLSDPEFLAEKFEAQIFAAATSESDYLEKISLWMLKMQRMSLNTMPDQVGNSSGGPGQDGALAVPGPHAVDWRAELQNYSRHQIVNIMIITLKKHPKFSGSEVLHKLKTMAREFEADIFAAATSELEYIHTIWLKMLMMETESIRMPDQVGSSKRPPDQASSSSAG